MNPSPPYPPAPWQLHGFAVLSLRLADAKRARELVPGNVQVLQVLPGRTIAVIYCARYDIRSSLSYSELAVAPALVRARNRVGFWITHIYVDHALSIAGGRAIWKLPKQFARFEWDAESVRVAEGPQELCRVEWDAGTARIPLPLLAPVLVEATGRFGAFWPRGQCRLSRRHGRVSAARESPVASLELTGTHPVVVADNLALTVPPPRWVGTGGD